jgi:hypothetical protein
MMERRMSGLSVAAILVAIVGVFGTWRSTGPVSLDGLEGPHNGWLTILFSLIALFGVRSLSHGGLLGIVLVVGCGAAMLVAPLQSLSLTGSTGWGVWLTVGASLVLVVTAVAAAAGRLRGSTPAGPRPSR